MYKALVRMNLRRTLAALSSGDVEAVAAKFGSSSVFQFHGDHALGGELHGRDKVRAMFERTVRIFPGVQVIPLRIAVNGWPWKTLLATRFSVRAPLPDGTEYRNEGMQ